MEAKGLIITSPAKFMEAIVEATRKETSGIDSVPRLHEGMSDGGMPYTREEHDVMWIKAEREDRMKEIERMRSLLSSLHAIASWACENMDGVWKNSDDKRVYMDSDFMKASLGWSAENRVDDVWTTRIVGGLIYHESSQTFGVHT